MFLLKTNHMVLLCERKEVEAKFFTYVVRRAGPKRPQKYNAQHTDLQNI